MSGLTRKQTVVFVDHQKRVNDLEDNEYDVQRSLVYMINSEACCAKMLTFMQEAVSNTSISCDEVLLGDAEEYIYRKFAKDCMFYILTFGFVPFRLRKVSGEKVILPFVIPYDQIEWNYAENTFDCITVPIEVSFKNVENHAKEDIPQIFTFSFSNEKRFGLLYSCLNDYFRMNACRQYFHDCLDLNRKNIVLWNQRSNTSRISDKLNQASVSSIVNQPLPGYFQNASLPEEVNMQINEQRDREMEEYNDKKHIITEHTKDDPFLNKYCHCFALPMDSTASVHSFSPREIDMLKARKMFTDSIMDAVNLPHGWYDELNSADNRNKKSNSSEYMVTEMVKNLKKKVQTCISFVRTLIQDESSQYKIKKSKSNTEKTDDKKNYRSIAVEDLHVYPVVSCKLQSVETKDIDFILKLYKEFIISHEEFESIFANICGLNVDSKSEEMHDAEYKSKMQQISAAAQNETVATNQNIKKGNKRKTIEDKQDDALKNKPKPPEKMQRGAGKKAKESEENTPKSKM